MKFSKQVLFLLSLFTLIGFSLFGILLIYLFQDTPIKEVLFSGQSWNVQLLKGSLFGVVAAVNAIVLVKGTWFKNSLKFFTDLIRNLQPSYGHVVFYSFCAAVGEEILFRAAIQPHLGIWLTSILFILLHGYINPYNWPMSLYGVFMILISSGIGYLFEHCGLLGAMSAHFVFDVAMFSFLKMNVSKAKDLS